MTRSTPSRITFAAPNGTTLTTTAQQGAILAALLNQPSKVVPRSALAIELNTTETTIKVQICYLRRELVGSGWRIATRGRTSYALETGS